MVEFTPPPPALTPATLPDRVRAAIAPAHVAVERTAFAKGMVTGTVSRTEYVAGLRQLAHLHAALEDCLAAAASPHVNALYDPARMARAPQLAADLAALAEDDEAVDPAEPVARLAESLRGWADRAPHALVGALYVLEGSRMGSMLLARSLTRALGVEPRPGHGLDYHLDGIATRPADWKAFKATLAGLPLTEAERDEVVHAATVTMDALVALYAAVPVAALERAAV